MSGRAPVGERARPFLLEPKTKTARLLRDLAEAAMSVCNHDASADEPGYQHDVMAMERRFATVLARYGRPSPSTKEEIG